MAVNQRHNLPAFQPSSQSSGATEIILRRGRNIHQGRYRSPACRTTTKPRLRRRTPSQRARISCSFMMIYCEDLLMEETAKVFRYCYRGASRARSGCRHLLPDRRWFAQIHLRQRSRITAFVKAVYPCTGIGQHNSPGKTHPSVSVGVAGTNIALTADPDHCCSITHRLTDSCSRKPHGCRFENSRHRETGHILSCG